ncbi:MAG TPA: GWxTD domain-containing protein [Candidatus Cloacimonadota bacterium]|nr:GWxTD domain-containing protein [Candidatus Cloacimonadota bacterium]
MKNTIFKCLLLSALLLLSVMLQAQNKLNMSVHELRFKDASGQTLLHIDYQIPYRNLVFVAQGASHFATVDVSVSISQGDSLVVIKDLLDNVGITNKSDATSDKSHINRVSFLLDESVKRLYFKAEDLNSGSVFTWPIDGRALGQDELLSDVQLCSIVTPDSTSTSKFRKGNLLYKSEPSLIFDKVSLDNVHLYLETYIPEHLQGTGLMNLYIEKDSLIVKDDYFDIQIDAPQKALHLQIPTRKLEAGFYQGILSLQIGDSFQEKEFDFFITEKGERVYSLMANPDEELQLLKYFTAGATPLDWSRYDEATKKRYLSSIWKHLGSSAGLSTEAILSIVEERVDHANANFRHFKDGWQTDMGRIYIRNGAADDVEKDSIQEITRYVSKDYQIWKYRGKIKAVYVFMDLQMNGNYQLIYVRGDDLESSRPDYLRYLGEDFDMSKLD